MGVQVKVQVRYDDVIYHYPNDQEAPSYLESTDLSANPHLYHIVLSYFFYFLEKKFSKSFQKVFRPLVATAI